MIKNFSPINASDNFSFAAFTIQKRFPVIIDKIIEDNAYSISVTNSLQELKYEVQNKNICHSIKTGNDKDNWNKWIKPHVGQSWFEAPFYFVEAYFYRLILDIVDFNTSGLDPFAAQKQEDVSTNISIITSILMDYRSTFDANSSKTQILAKLFYTSLWGNKADLSQLTNRIDNNAPTDATIIDDLEMVVTFFEYPLNCIDIILDNSGVELFTDLLLSEKLVSLGLVYKVILHAKAYPTFVSDATLDDIDYLLNVLRDDVSTQAQELLRRINSLKKTGNIIFKSHEFWNSPHHFYDMPHDLEYELEKSDLIIFKGDANYRRVFGDRELPHELVVTDHANFLPSRSLAIRILKSEILVGMKNIHVEEISQKDKDWLVNGKYGIIQLLKQG